MLAGEGIAHLLTPSVLYLESVKFATMGHGFRKMLQAGTAQKRNMQCLAVSLRARHASRPNL